MVWRRTLYISTACLLKHWEGSTPGWSPLLHLQSLPQSVRRSVLLQDHDHLAKRSPPTCLNDYRPEYYWPTSRATYQKLWTPCLPSQQVHFRCSCSCTTLLPLTPVRHQCSSGGLKQRGWAALNTWGYTSVRTSPGHSTAAVLPEEA